MPSADPAAMVRTRTEWKLLSRTLGLGARTLLMGIVNVTPDSFSDGGHHATTQAAVAHALCLLDEGADILDIGGESTRPGSAAATDQALSEAEEQDRVLPVIEAVLRSRPGAVLSIDTYRASTARAAVGAGARIVNDVSGLLWDLAMAETVADLRCGLVLMHTRGLPSEWKRLPPLSEEEVVSVVLEGLWERMEAANAAGIASDRIVLDPGFGFGKRGPENWALLHKLSRLQELGRPLLVGLSRKGFLAPKLAPEQRDAATHRANAVAVAQGAQVLRVHDVAGARRALLQGEERRSGEG